MEEEEEDEEKEEEIDGQKVVEERSVRWSPRRTNGAERIPPLFELIEQACDVTSPTHTPG